MLLRRAPMLWSLLACVLSIAVAVPASATEGPGDDEQAPLESGAAQQSSNLRESARTAPSGGGGGFFTVNQRSHPVAPGLELTSFDRYDALGWIRVDALTADLSAPGLRLDYASPGKVSSTAPLSLALRCDDAVAGVNADFFDIGDTGAPLGIGVDRQRGVVHGSSASANNTFTLDSGNAARIARTYLSASVLRKGKPTIPVTT